MSKQSPTRFPTEGMGEAYEKLLKLTMEEAKLLKEKTGPILHKLIDTTSEKISELGELTEEEAEKISQYLKRDLREAASYMTETGADFKKWLAIDTEIIEDFLLEQFKQAADQTKIELAKLKAAGETAEYHTGEITGPGVLLCDACGENLHFHKAGHIPPCAKCNGTHFHRLFCQ
ncbi:MAG: zinc ribbon-containing protein [Gammaproteobacteria bacterium]|nr:zinc ribbon-containing protein [Gammaproteobacteria bacterium]